MHTTVESAKPELKARPAGGWLRRLVPPGLVVVAVALVVLIALMPSEPPAPPASGRPATNVAVLTVRAEPELADTFTLTAVVEPNRVVRVAAEVPGRIERIGVRRRATRWAGRLLAAGATLAEGEPVSEGDPLVQLNAELLRARLARAEAQFEYDQREYQRLLGLFERGATSRTELDNARTRRDMSRASLREATEELERATIKAPLDGILNRLPVEVGEYVGAGDVVAEIVDSALVKVVVDAPERDVQYLRTGQTAEILLRAPRARTFSGRISYISELADERTRTTRLEIRVPNPGRQLRSGQIVRARLTRRLLHDVIMIPLGAVIPLENGKAVYVVDDDGRAQRRPVELGLIKGRRVQIVSGLSVGQRLIVAGQRLVGPGQPVRVVEQR